MDLDDFKFDEVILKDALVINILMTNFYKVFFGRPDLMRDLFNHFKSVAK